MFKAKILSLYFPKQFLNVCSGEHLELLGSELGLGENLPLSQYQHLLFQAKLANAMTRHWSNPKFMMLLFELFIPDKKKTFGPIEKIRKKIIHKINFEDIQKQRSAIGKKAEIFALAWEKERLTGAGLNHLVSRIEDRRDRPGFGHDFLSYSSDKQPRFIEVKSILKLDQGHRFFLSDNEHQTSKSAENQGNYYFYLVSFDGKGKPNELVPVLASSLYLDAELTPSAYTVRFMMNASWIKK
jgi:hypothetical protein